MLLASRRDCLQDLFRDRPPTYIRGRMSGSTRLFHLSKACGINVECLHVNKDFAVEESRKIVVNSPRWLRKSSSGLERSVGAKSVTAGHHRDGFIRLSWLDKNGGTRNHFALDLTRFARTRYSFFSEDDPRLGIPRAADSRGCTQWRIIARGKPSVDSP